MYSWLFLTYIYVYIHIYIYTYFRPSIRSPGSVRARVEEIEQQESSRIQCWAKCDFDRGLFLMQRLPSYHVLSKTHTAHTIAKPPSVYCSLFPSKILRRLWIFLAFFVDFWWLQLCSNHTSWKHCATVPCRSPNRAGATADSKQVAAKQQLASEFVFPLCLSERWFAALHESI